MDGTSSRWTNGKPNRHTSRAKRSRPRRTRKRTPSWSARRPRTAKTKMATSSLLSDLPKLWEGAGHVGTLHFPFEPTPASRPRVTRWGTYFQKPYQDWKDKAKAFLEDSKLSVPTGTLMFVVVENVRTKARTSKLTTPVGDTDNYYKSATDSITKAGLWQDDRFIVTGLSTKRFTGAGESAHVAVHVFALP